MISMWMGKSLRASALAVAVMFAGWSAPSVSGAPAEVWVGESDSAVPKAQSDAYANVYIIGLRQRPLAVADTPGDAQVFLPRTSEGRLDVSSAEAVAYVERVEQEQDRFLAEAAQVLGRPVAPIAPEFRFQHAFNGMVLRLTEAEVVELASSPEVATVEPYTEYVMDTDAGPNLIGAPGIWSGAAVPTGVGTRGEGVVVGIIDSGINFDSPSFATVEPGNPGIPGGYAHINPYGVGSFLGTCASGGVDAGLCNDKLIGGYDFVFAVQCNIPPPAAPCPAGTIDEPSVEDNNGHGTHTASTTAGNAVVAPFSGITVPLSGVARHANIIAYDVCYTRLSDGAGLCPNVSTLAAINQTVADGVVDVINYSISGGAQPWNEANSLAFLNAAAAGIYVAASAGNSGPGPGTLGHVEPWVASTGAATHNRVFGYDFDLTGPIGPPANTQDIIVRPGGAPIATASVVDIPLIVSPNFGTPASDGCSPPIGVAYPADFFRRPAVAGGTQGLAVLRLPAVGSLCGSGTRRTNALAAGAAGVLFVVDGPTNLGANMTTWQMDNVPHWGNVLAHVNTDPSTATATITAPVAPFLTQQPDVLAAFSSRGPSGFDLLKPDVIAPGVNVLAAVAGPSTAYALNSGTSMSSPHHAGSAALMRAVYPTWTNAEVKSAIMSTAKTSAVFKENATTPADPHDRGAGRIDLSFAADVGIVFDETAADYTAANPAIGGDPSTLNLASLQNDNCVGTCTFTRGVRSVRAGTVTYTLAVAGFPAGAVSVSPASFNIGTNGAQNFTVSVDSLLLTQNVWAFGELTLTPSSPEISTSHLPIAIRAAQPDVAVSPTSFSVTLAPGASTTRSLTVRNDGNPSITWANDAAGQATILLQQQPNNAANGFSTNFYSGQAPTPGGVYTSDDVSPLLPVTLRTIRVEGFMTGAGTQALNVLATAITFKVYADMAGVPAGNPEAGAGGELYSCVRTPTGPNSAGLSFLSADGAFYALDLAAATGCPAGPVLTVNTPYWVAVFPTVPGNSGSRRWVWFRGIAQNGNPAKIISPLGIGGAPTTWTSIAPVAAFAGSVSGDVQCGASWLNATPGGATLGLAGQSDVTVTIDAAGLLPANYFGAVCVDTLGTDPDEPKVPVPVILAVVSSPSGLGSAAPASAAAFDTAVLTVAVTPGGNPVSSGVTVVGNLSAIGGSATQSFLDDGVAPDAAVDGVYTAASVVPLGTSAGNKLLPFAVTDAQLRSSSGNIALEILAPTSPAGTGLATPASIAATASTVLTVTTTAGTNPASSGVGVTVDLSSIGGSATTTFLDDGSPPDATSGDGVYSFLATPPLGTAGGNKSLAFAVTDAQARLGSGSIALEVLAPTSPSGNATATPASVAPSASTLLTIAVTAGSNPSSTSLAVRADLSAIGGLSSQAFLDDGLNGDAVAADGTFSFNATVPLSTTPGSKLMPFTITDPEQRTGSGSIPLTVLAPTAPSGVAAATPPAVPQGSSSLITVVVTLGQAPASTGIIVRADLSSLGLSASQALYDDGSNGDAVAADGTYSVTANVPVAAAIGQRTIGVSIQDAQGRSATANTTLAVQPTNLLADGFEDPVIP